MIALGSPFFRPLRRFGRLVLALGSIGAPVFCLEATAQQEEIPLLHNGGGAYFLADSGTLKIRIYRSDRLEKVSRWDTDREMKVRLFDPVRKILVEKEVPPPPKQKLSSDWSSAVSLDLEVEIEHRGVFFLLVTMKRDSYLESVRWGFQTNAKHYLIDAGGGHRDAARKEVIKFLSIQGGARITFQPRSSPLSFSALNLDTPKGETLKFFAGVENKELLQERTITNGRVHTVLSLDKPALVTAEIPGNSGELVIESVTLPPESASNWMPLWTTETSAYFNLEATHWLMRPRHQVHPRPGDASIRLDPGPSALAGEVSIIDEGLEGSSIRQRYPLSLAAGAEEVLRVSAPADNGIIRTRVRFENETTPPAEGVVVWRDDQQNAKDLVLPLALRPFRHSPENFGFDPAETPSAEIYFSSQGQAWFTGEEGFFVRTEDGWKEILSEDAGYGRPSTQRLFADQKNRIYGLTSKGHEHFLLAFRYPEGLISALPLPPSIRGRIVIETNTSPDRGMHPPVILSYERRGKNPRDPSTIWGVDHRLNVVIPEWQEGSLRIGGIETLSDHCIGLADHSGRSAPVTTLGGKSFIVYGETSPPEANDPGVPTYVIPIDRQSAQAGSRNLVGYAPPANDIHNVSSILTDSDGFLHVITGAHNHSFGYTRSVRPLDPTAWQPNEAVAPDYDQTYVGAVMDAEDRLHLISRIWRRGEPFPEDPFDTALIHQTRSPGENQTWSQPKILLTGPLPHYGIYYHRVTVDPLGFVHLAWTHWPTWSSYRNEMPGLAPPGNAFGYLHWQWNPASSTWAWQMDWNKAHTER